MQISLHDEILLFVHKIFRFETVDFRILQC